MIRTVSGTLNVSLGDVGDITFKLQAVTTEEAVKALSLIMAALAGLDGLPVVVTA